MQSFVYILIALALLFLLFPRARREKKPFDWNRRHNWWTRWRARSAFMDR